MREIKFRAWLDDDKKMYNNAGVIGKIVVLEHSAEGDVDDVTDFEPLYWGPIDDSTIHVMQFTGLTDKNGKEIYEGDIVQIKDHAFQGTMNIDGNYLVYYNEYMELCCGSLILHRQLPYITVIGNIYENPELLEVV